MRTELMLAWVALACLVGTARAGEKGDWIELIRGEGMEGWRKPTGQWMNVGQAVQDPKDEKRIATQPGHGILVNGKTGKTRNLLTELEHGDVEAHIEFMVPKGSNSGVYFMGRYEVQVLDSWGKDQVTYGDCGGIYQRWDPKRKPRGFEGHAPRENASKPPGQWQTFDVVFLAPRFDEGGRKVAHAKFVKVVHNGVVVHEDVEVTGPTRAAAYGDEKPAGPLMFQGDHGPVAYRNLRLRHLEPGEAGK
ncbi:MAG: DUF1080 domain-containing protein [Candidatus Brocadiia bacterium]